MPVRRCLWCGFASWICLLSQQGGHSHRCTRAHRYGGPYCRKRTRSQAVRPTASLPRTSPALLPVRELNYDALADFDTPTFMLANLSRLSDHLRSRGLALPHLACLEGSLQLVQLALRDAGVQEPRQRLQIHAVACQLLFVPGFGLIG